MLHGRSWNDNPEYLSKVTKIQALYRRWKARRLYAKKSAFATEEKW